jgi:PAS domain S-box-containing protein
VIRGRDEGSTRSIFEVGSTGAAVFLLSWLSIAFTRELGGVTAVWPANAVIVAALLRSEPKRWPLRLLAGFGGLLAGSLANGATSWTAVGLNVCDMLDVLICVAGMRMALGRDIDLTRGFDLVVFLVYAGLVAPLVSAAPAAWLLGAAFHGRFSRYLIEWSATTSLGLLIVTPALLALTPATLASLVGRHRIGRTAVLFSLLASCLATVFLQARLPLLFLVMPVLILITFQLDLAGGALAVLITAAAAAAQGAIEARSMAAPGGMVANLILTQLFLAAITMSVLAAAAMLGQRRRLTESLAVALAEADAARARVREIEDLRWAAMAEEIAGVGHWRFDQETEVTVWSGQIFRIYGLDPAKGVPDLSSTLELYHPEDRSLVAQNIEDARRAGRPFAFDVRVVRPDGEMRHVSARGAAERGADGDVRAIFGVFVDVTEAKRAEQVMRESEARYRLLAENATDIIVQFNLSGEITFVTPACEAVVGRSPAQMVGLQALDLIHPDDLSRVSAAFGRFIAAGPNTTPIAVQYRVRHKAGHWVWIESQPKVIFDADGEPVSIQDVIRDVTERKAFELELARAREAAEAATISKSDFLANMSHEIRTPLTAVIGFSDLLEGVAGLSDEARRYVQRIVTGGRSLLAVVNDILDFSKLEAGQLELDPQPFDPRAVVEGALALVEAQAGRKGLTLTTRLDGDLPASVLADSSRLNQVLLNLLTNSIKFTAEGAVSVTVGYRAEEGRLRLAVTDTGSGIAADKLCRLFERFSQVDGSISRRHGGTGLGLAICKDLVELMGGEIGAASTVGAGSTFSFSIAAPVVAWASDGQPDGPDEARAPDGEPAHILVVDDLAANRELVRTVLEALGHTVAEAIDGDDAVRAALSERFDMILMDMQMPGTDGPAAAQMIRRTAGPNAATPILALTGNVMPDQIARCRDAGMDDHIAKPFKLEVLVAKVMQWTRHPDADPIPQDTRPRRPGALAATD